MKQKMKFIVETMAAVSKQELLTGLDGDPRLQQLCTIAWYQKKEQLILMSYRCSRFL